MTIYLLAAFLLSLICGVTLTPLILDYCKQKGIYDIPNERKIHKTVIPRMGGIAFLPSMLMSFFVILMLLPVSNTYDLHVSIWSAVFMMGMIIIYLTGIIDDWIGLSAISKFCIQIITGSLLPLCGLYINNLYGLFGVEDIPYYVGIPITVFMMVLINNAINLIDGIDGLAASLSIIALTGFLAYFIYYDVFLHTYALLSAGLIGALLAFLYFNMWGKQEKNSKIFMGDSGSLSLGFLLGFLFVKTASENLNIWPHRQDALLVPLTLLMVPLADVVRITIYRLCHHKPLFQADKNHIHHKLMRAGLSQHQTMGIIISISLIYIIVNYLLFQSIGITYVLLLDIALYVLLQYAIDVMIKHRKEVVVTT